MSVRGPFARALIAALAVVVTVLTFAPAASATTPGDVCAEFPYEQTYLSEIGLFRAPAWHYDAPVTIVYETESCEANVTSRGRYVLSISGTASVHEGLTSLGRPLAQRPFTSVIRAHTADPGLGWPVAWWSCFEGSFSYVWTIEDVYVFSVTAEDGRWVMAQRDPSSDKVSARVADACRTR